MTRIALLVVLASVLPASGALACGCTVQHWKNGYTAYVEAQSAAKGRAPHEAPAAHATRQAGPPQER